MSFYYVTVLVGMVGYLFFICMMLVNLFCFVEFGLMGYFFIT